jgi:hypothetical protein
LFPSLTDEEVQALRGKMLCPKHFSLKREAKLDIRLPDIKILGHLEK